MTRPQLSRSRHSTRIGISRRSGRSRRNGEPYLDGADTPGHAGGQWQNPSLGALRLGLFCFGTVQTVRLDIALDGARDQVADTPSGRDTLTDIAAGNIDQGHLDDLLPQGC